MITVAKIQYRQKLKDLLGGFEKYRDHFDRLQKTIDGKKDADRSFYVRMCLEINSLCKNVESWHECVAECLVKGHFVGDLHQAKAWLSFYGGGVSVAGKTEVNIQQALMRYDWMDVVTARNYCFIVKYIGMFPELERRLQNLDEQDFVHVPAVQEEDDESSEVLKKIDSAEINEKIRELNASVKTVKVLQAEIKALYDETKKSLEKLQLQIEQDQKRLNTVLTDASEANKKVNEKSAAADKKFEELTRQGDVKLQELKKFSDEARAKAESALETYKSQYNAHLEELSQFKDIALAKGLSEIYLEKEKKETKTYEKYTKCFYVTLGFLTVILLTPLLIIFWHGMPSAFWKLMICYPLEVPTFWLLFFFSKRAKIAHRLAEDYVHKKLVGLVYQGLRERVKELGETNAEDAKRLQALLLQAVVTTTATNSGDLIKGFNQPDCPITDVLKSFEFRGAKVNLSGDEKDK